MASQADRECAEGTAKCIFCWSCAGICFDEEEEIEKRYGCAASLFGVTYGSLTTALSAGAWNVTKSSVGLGFGITAVVLGVCGCLCLGCQKCASDESSGSSSDDRPVVTQPI